MSSAAASLLFKPLEDALRDAFPELHDDIRSHYGAPLTPEIVRAIEAELGLSLPRSYVDLMMAQNGGSLSLRWEGTDDDHYIDLGDLLPLDHRIDGELYSAYMINEWEYPSPSYWLGGDGHTAILLDYRSVQLGGEPSVLYVDLESSPETQDTIFANFGEFLDYLVAETKNSLNVWVLRLVSRTWHRATV